LSSLNSEIRSSKPCFSKLRKIVPKFSHLPLLIVPVLQRKSLCIDGSSIFTEEVPTVKALLAIKDEPPAFVSSPKNLKGNTTLSLVL
jgi:hypothetical protein